MGQSSNFFGYALNTLQAAGADIAAADGNIILTGINPIPYDDILASQRKVKIIPYVAGTARDTDIDFLAAPTASDATVRFSYEQVIDNTGEVLTGDIIITAKAGETDAVVAAKAKAVIDGLIASGQMLATTSLATAKLTVIATAAGKMLRFLAPSAGVSFDVQVAGAPTVGAGAQLVNFYVIENLLTTNNYTQIVIPFKGVSEAATEGGSFNEIRYAVNVDNEDYADFLTKATEIFSGLAPGESPPVANPELLAVL